ncbi:MAG: hypothetical protein QF926_05000 [Alphaproteobacteria bacterium]|jgi:hypothetical protein|nr:hypothetical protein [Alphaproteobacteria bacterium]
MNIVIGPARVNAAIPAIRLGNRVVGVIAAADSPPRIRALSYPPFLWKTL